MQNMTLLEIVQNIASALETDEINSITDTTESLQIAEVVKETFLDLFTNTDIPEHMGLVRLDSVSDLASPNYLKIPDDVNKISWLRYKDYRGQNYRLLRYANPRDFIEMALLWPLDEIDPTIVDTVDPVSGVVYKIRSDSPPLTYTIFNDQYIAFDAFDSVYEATVQGDNCVSFGSFNFEFEMEDDFVPPIDANLFPLLLSEAKSVCFINLKQVSSAKEEQRSRRQKRKFQREKFKSRVQRNEYWTRGNDFSRNR
jgi:hypothetical protein